MANGLAVRQRRDVWRLTAIDPWHPTLLWYSKAVQVMQTRRYTDPTGWLYQAGIHDYASQVTPPPKPGDPLPSSSEQKRFWRRCQHGSWFFLPWHRMYLFDFERIVAAAVTALGGPADWSLPYWNYSDVANPNGRLLPPAFIEPNLPDGTPNSLRVEKRDYTATGNVDVSAADVDLSCLEDTVFAGAGNGATGGFGGQITGFSHNGSGPGGLERTPHGTVHGSVGGFMGRFETAGLDPIFWLHHANIDRLWEVWRQRSPLTHTDPSEAAWLNATGTTFEFHDENGTIVQWLPRQVATTTASPLNYTYEDVSDPLPAKVAAVSGGIAITMKNASGSTPMPMPLAELVGATGAPLPMRPEITTVEVPLRAPSGPARIADALDVTRPARRVFLNLENITGQGDPTNYSVYLNIPPGQSPAQHEELFVGSMPTFGVTEASNIQHPHGGSGLTHVLDITAVVDRLAAQGDWDAGKVRVSFLPRKPLKPGAQVQVGRVSVYYRSE